MQEIKEAPREIKVTTRKFRLKAGVIYVKFEFPSAKGTVTGLKLRQRNAVEYSQFPFELDVSSKKGRTVYSATLDSSRYPMEISFWDVVATVKENGSSEEYDAILGGLGMMLKLRLILFPRWTRTGDDCIIYPFVNGARQFTIQYRRYYPEYDSYRFIAKEWLALFCYFILKPYWDSKGLWLICEKYSAMAQDNGLYFFKYCMREAPPDRRKHILYVIDKKVPDYAAVREYDDNVIEFMTFRYMIYLCAARYLISTDAIRHFYIWDSPNSIFKVLYQARKNIIFLQHGVMGFKQCHRTFHKKGGNRMALFVVSSQFEQKIIHDYFEYDDDEIIITGLARWDVLQDKSLADRKEILLMPTWRSWLEDVSREKFEQSEYYSRYREFLEDDGLKNYLEERNITLNFYIHPKFREHIESFGTDSEHIRFIPFGSRPLNELLMSCNMLITDYSSVSWDVYYQEKPVVFYPFDLDTYEKYQGSYMDYHKDMFGDVVWTKAELLECIRKYVDNGFEEEEKFAAKRDFLLPLRDSDNSKRIYEFITNAHIPAKLRNTLKNRR